MKILENAKPENCFYCIDGSVLHNLLELRQKLKTITPQAFYHHVSQSKNDFHNWIRDVFQDYELANDILKAKTPAAAAAAAATVDRHIKKALIAEEEIEQAISRIIKARAKATTSAPPAAAKKPKQKPQMKKKKTRQPQKVQKNKNTGKKRKLNKKSGNNKHHKGRKSSGGNSNYGNKNRIRHGRSKKRGRKQVNMWLKWLKLVPEL